MHDFTAGALSAQLWLRAQPIIDRIESLPFLGELIRGTLDPVRFVGYLRQDDLYLRGYARAMALLAAKAEAAGQARFWAESVCGAIAAEEDMHRALLADPRLSNAHARSGAPAPQASPTTLGYLSYLNASAALRPYPVGVAVVLPCFWVYAHVGKKLTQRAQGMTIDHPYRTWIALYDSPEFDGATRTAVGILEQCLARAHAPEREEMATVFLQACMYEWHFWHAAYIQQGWDLPTTPCTASATT